MKGDASQFANHHAAQACRDLWMAVAREVLVDAIIRVAKSQGPRFVTVRHEMIYFARQDWRQICNLAGISHKPEAIRAFLMSDMVRTSGPALYRDLGLIDRSHRADPATMREAA